MTLTLIFVLLHEYWSIIYLFNFFGDDSIELLEIMFDGRAFHSLAVVGENTISECVGRVSNLEKLAVMFA